MANYPIAQWKAQPLPYCITRFNKARDRFWPLGSKRFATPEVALAEATRLNALPSNRDHMLFVDFASAYGRAQVSA